MSGAGSAEEPGILQRHGQGCVERLRGLEDPNLPLSAPTGVQLAPTSPKLVEGRFSEVHIHEPVLAFTHRAGYPTQGMGDFFSDLKSILGPRMLWEVMLGMRRNDLLGLAGQLAYFFLLFFFPFLIFLVSLTGLVIGNPEAGLKNLFEALSGLVPANARLLVVDYVDRTLRTANAGVLMLGILGALWLGQAASISITKAANRSYQLEESRPFWRLRGTCLIMTLGFTLLVAVLTLALFNIGAYLSAIAGLPEILKSLGKLSSWAMVFVAITLALDVLYYLAPDAKLPFKWITPGGFIATVLLFVSDAALSYYVANLGNYGQIYGQLGTVIVFMLWLYVTGLMVLLGLEINAVLARTAEERKGIELVQTE
jgi:membrane protein